MHGFKSRMTGSMLDKYGSVVSQSRKDPQPCGPQMPNMANRWLYDTLRWRNLHAEILRTSAQHAQHAQHRLATPFFRSVLEAINAESSSRVSGAGCPPGPVDRIDGADADADDVREPPAPRSLRKMMENNHILISKHRNYCSHLLRVYM